MSSVSGFGSVTSSQLLQRTRDGQAGQADRMDQAFNTALQTMGVDSSKAASITKQIQSAVQDAAKSSAGSSDPRAAVQQAVDGVLTKNGIDPQQFKTQFQAAMKKLGGNNQAKPAENSQPPSAQAATAKQATSTTSTALEEAMETHADTLKEARAGDRQAKAKLAAEEKAAAATKAKENGLNVTA